VPDGADASWRRRQVAAWLERAADLRRHGRVLVLAGVVEPNDADDAMHRAGGLQPRFCLLDAREDVLDARLRGRLQAPGAAADLLRVTGQTPDQFIHAVARHAMHLRASLAARDDAVIIDTSELSPIQVAEAVLTAIDGSS
jgi:hypothetical protein